MSFCKNEGSCDIELVIFDMAGTVVDYGSCAPAGVFIDLFAKRGIDVSIEEARTPMGLQKKDHIRMMSQMPSIRQKWLHKFSREVTEQDIHKMYEDFIPMQIEQLCKFSQIIPGAADVFDSLRKKNIKIAATTGYNRQMTSIVTEEMKKQGLEADAVVCAEDVESGRPAPWMIFRCMEMLGVFAVHRVFKVGDTIADILAACNAGVWSAAVVMHGNEVGLARHEAEAMTGDQTEAVMSKAKDRFSEAGADFVLEGVWQVPQKVEEINRIILEHHKFEDNIKTAF